VVEDTDTFCDRNVG